MPTPNPARPYALLVAATAGWGAGTVLSKLALDRGLAPMVLLVVELLASCSFVLVVLGSRGRPTTTGSWPSAGSTRLWATAWGCSA